MIKQVKESIKRIAYFCAIAIIAFGCCSEVKLNEGFENQKNVDHLMQSTVMITMKEERIVCTGFFIAPRLLASARHCFTQKHILTIETGEKGPELKQQELSSVEQLAILEQKKQNIIVRMLDYRVFSGPGNTVQEHSFKRGKIVWTPLEDFGKDIETHDFVFIELLPNELSSRHWLPFAEAVPKINEKLYSVSHPEAMPWNFLSGIMSSYIYNYDKFPDIMFYRVQMPYAEGSSGGAVVNERGEVVGMIHKTNQYRTLGIMIPSHVMSEHYRRLQRIGPN